MIDTDLRSAFMSDVFHVLMNKTFAHYVNVEVPKHCKSRVFIRVELLDRSEERRVGKEC